MERLERSFSHERPPILDSGKCPAYLPWRKRIRAFAWQWYAMVMATAVTSSLLHLFPYSRDLQVTRVFALVVFFLALGIFIFNVACMLCQAYLYPKEWRALFTDPTKNCFSGFVAVAVAGLLEGALNINEDWNTGHAALLYALWGFWWLDATLAFVIGFGVMYTILGQRSRNLSQVAPTWIVPVVALITLSTCGGLFSEALTPHSHNLALTTTTFAMIMALIGLFLTTMISWFYLLRLFLEGSPDATVVLATLNTLTPLGQGGYSLLINGHNISRLLPAHLGDDFPQGQLAGKLVFATCFCFAFFLWCAGLAWITVSILVISRRARRLPRFGITWWSIVFPNGVYALCSVQLGKVLDSPFFKVFGTVWSVIVFTMWTGLVLRSVPAFIDGTLFMLPAPHHSPAWKEGATALPRTDTILSEADPQRHSDDASAITAHEPEQRWPIV